MAHLIFWLHMNDEYMWRWYCSDRSGNLIAISAQSFFRLADAKSAIDEMRDGISDFDLAA